MSRSFRHTMKRGIHQPKAGSEKWFKAYYHGVERARVRNTLGKDVDFDDISFTTLREIADIWSYPKDGKHWYGKCIDLGEGWIRKYIIGK